ncbi:hypothetical protein [Longimicrobium terrae]|uniref:Uncharacterized protein n=1 Tax=Longimicrobium terrae TaxID=1639882 RepID=A0A841GX92_9BACT|nr:hypothetical protein [Longimicrobium terrae]MBB4635212.1 hypothetical protein [Longimicrobium terrae]MBB6069606.1 hypothetical protein [Longimicrobium terrae]NNC31592.1 hypothetical protein [Longimicrobium terrae]
MQSELARLFDEVPDELVVYFERVQGAAIPHLLKSRNAADLTLTFREFHPVIQVLGGVVLDDEDTSDHHLYLTRPPLAGMILHLSHDGDSHVVFPSLDAYLSAAQAARDSGDAIAGFHPPQTPRAADPRALGALITELLDGYDEESTAMIVATVLPSLDLVDADLLSRLAAHEDFYLGEAVANEIARRPSRELAAVARLCAAHRHPQAAAAGTRALEAIAAIR